MSVKRSNLQKLRADPIARSMEQTRRALSTSYSNTPGQAEMQAALVASIKALIKVDPHFEKAIAQVMADAVADDFSTQAADILLNAGVLREVTKVVSIDSRKRKAGARGKN